MRFLMHVVMPVEQFNEAVRDGSAEEKVARILAEAKPEAAYFCAFNGQRSCFLVVNLKDTSEIPRYAEPWFLWFGAKVDFLPTMTPEDLQAAGLGDIAREWA